MTAIASLTVDQLVRLSGLSDRHLRRLAAAGHLPRPVRDRYPLVPAITGLLRHYREREEAQVLRDHYPTLPECSAATGIPLGLLKQARRQGCPGVDADGVTLMTALPWLMARTHRDPTRDEQARAQRAALQNAKLRVELQRLRRELLPANEARALGAQLGHAIRKALTRLPRLAPSLAGQAVEVIAQRLREHEAEVLAHLPIVEDRLRAWQQAAER